MKDMADKHVTHDEFDTAMTAIKQDFDRLESKVDQGFAHADERFEQIDERFVQVDRRFEQVDRRLEQVLTILTSIDANMKELRGLPARVARLVKARF